MKRIILKHSIIAVMCVLIVIFAGYFVIREASHIRNANDLCDAISSDNMDSLEELLEDGMYVNGYTSAPIFLPIYVFMDSNYPITPLMMACEMGNLKAVELLLDYGADPSQKYVGSFSCIGAVYASKMGREQRFEIIPLLINHGADPGNTGHADANHAAFLEAKFASEQTAEESITLLKQMTQDPAAIIGRNGETLLHEFCKGDCISGIEWLIAEGADINAVDGQSCTPLMYAVKAENVSVVKFLIQKGCSTTIEE